MICKRCLQTRRRSFFEDGTCEQCLGYVPKVAEPIAAAFLWEHIVAAAKEYHDALGWVGEAEARDRKVVSSGSAVYVRNLGRRVELLNTLPRPAECIAWVLSLIDKPDEEATDYECRLALLARQVWIVDREQFITMAGAYHAWLKEKAKRPAPEPPPQVLTGQHFGTVGERVVIAGCQCTLVQSLGTNDEHPEWGERFLVKFVEPGGCQLTWFTGEGGFDPEQGRTYTIRATIKDHDSFAGQRCTLITRCADEAAPKKTRKKRED